MYVSTFTGIIYVVQLHCNLVSLKRNITSSLQLNSTLLYGIVSLNNAVYVSAYASNCTSVCNKVHSLTTYNDESLAFSDTGDFSIKVYNPAEKTYSVIVGNGKGTRDGSKAQFSQPTGICFDYQTLFAIDTATSTLHMASSVTSLVDYLEHVHIFGETFGLHTRESTSLTIEISQAIGRLKRVYTFNQNCVNAVMNLIGTTAVAQGPEGTISSVVMDDEKRILKSLREIKEKSVLIHVSPLNLALKVF